MEKKECVPAAPAPAEPQPSAQGPAELWLQLHGDCSEAELSEPVDYTCGDVTWCWHAINDTDVRYVRADLAGVAPCGEPLPPLPEAKVMVREADEEVRSLENGGWIVDCDCEGPLSYSLEAGEALYTADQMREYALAALGVKGPDVAEALRDLVADIEASNDVEFTGSLLRAKDALYVKGAVKAAPDANYREGYRKGYQHGVRGERADHRAGLNSYENGYCDGYKDAAPALACDDCAGKGIYADGLPCDTCKGSGTAGVMASEIERLRAEQAAGVMPQIGPLLDAWDGMDNDTKAVLREDAPDLAKALTAITRAMDGTDGVAAASDFTAEEARQGYRMHCGTKVYCCPGTYYGVGHDADCKAALAYGVKTCDGGQK